MCLIVFKRALNLSIGFRGELSDAISHQVKSCKLVSVGNVVWVFVVGDGGQGSVCRGAPHIEMKLIFVKGQSLSLQCLILRPSERNSKNSALFDL